MHKLRHVKVQCIPQEVVIVLHSRLHVEHTYAVFLWRPLYKELGLAKASSLYAGEFGRETQTL